jgi:outer membrane protein assembly factor BamB
VREIWRFSTRGAASGLAADDRRLYVGDAEGNLYALHDSAGQVEIVWKANVEQRISAAPLRWRHLLLVATHHPQGQLLALEVERGRLAWRRPLSGRGVFLTLPPPQPSPIRSTRMGERVGVGSRVAGACTDRGRSGAGSPLIVSATDRGLLSAHTLPEGDPLGWTFQAGGGLSAAPVAAGEMVYVGGGDGRLTALTTVSGAPRWSAALPERITGLAWWRDLLYVAARDGMLSIFQAETGALVCSGKATGRLTAGPFIHEGQLLVGIDSQGWIALPWHLGEYAWAARISQAWGELESAASYFVLSNDPQAAEACWVEAGQAEKAARMWAAFGEDGRAARLYCTAMETQRTRYPVLAAVYLHRAAEHFEAAAELAEAQRCLQQAGRMARFPYLTLEAFNLPASEAGQPLAIAVHLQNTGNGAAHNVRFRLGGQLARLIGGNLEQPLPAGFSDVLEFENLIPTSEGRQPLRLFLTYEDASGSSLQTDLHLELQVTPPPPGAITVTDDVGVIHVRVPAGAPLPSVRVRGMAAMVKYESYLMPSLQR